MTRKPLKIALAGTRGIPNHYGGFEQCAHYLSEGLVKLGHEVTVYSSSDHPYQEKKYRGVSIHHAFDPGFGALGQFVYDFNCILHARKQQFDVIIQFGYTSSSIWSMLWPKHSKHLVNIDGLEHQRAKFNYLSKLFLKSAEKWAINAADLLIADNPAISTYIQEKHISTQIIEIAYGAEMIATPYSANDVLIEFGLKKAKYDLMICRMEPENQVQEIIEAKLKNTSKTPLVIIGKTDINSYGRKLRRLFESNKVMFLEGIYDKSKLDALRFYCRFYFHGHSVGGTNPSLLEAMTCCRHIIAHKNPFNKSVLSEFGSYFESSNDLTILLNSFENSNIVADHLNATQAIIASSFSWEKIIAQYEKACYEALNF